MTTSAFYGADLIRIVRKYDKHSNLLNLLDPKGLNLVNMSLPHNDADEVRVFLMAKYRDSNEPQDAIVHMTFKDFNDNVQRLVDASEEIN